MFILLQGKNIAESLLCGRWEKQTATGKQSTVQKKNLDLPLSL